MVERRDATWENPPKWWHDAIRENFPGNMLEANQFITFPKTVGDRYSYTIISQTLDNPDGLPEGIYFDTTIPARLANNLSPFLPEMITPLTDLFKARAEEQGKIIEHPDPRLAALGAKINLGSSLRISIDVSDGFVLLILSPANIADTMKYDAEMGFDQFKDKLIDQYFTTMDLITRAKYVADPQIPVPLKKEILKREIFDMTLAITLAVKENLVKPAELNAMANDEVLQRKYEHFLEKMTTFQTPEEKQRVETAMELMDDQTIIGFYAFYKKYWQNKLGPLN